MPGGRTPVGHRAICCARIEIDGIEADFPRDGVGWIDIEEVDYYRTGRRMGEHGHAHAYYLIKGEWSEHCGSGMR